MKKVLVVGASSFIGSNIAVALRDEFRVFGTFHRSRPRLDSVAMLPFSVPSPLPLNHLVDLVKPDALIYCVGVADDRVCQSDPLAALGLNGEAPAAFAALMEQRKGQFFFLSTSKVFSGETGGYSEDDPVHPRTVYGKTKARGEEMIHRHAGAFILRLGTIFGIGARGQNSILNRTWKELASGNETRYISDEFRTFYGVDFVVQALRHLLHLDPTYSGLFHLGHPKKDSYYTFAKATAAAFGLSMERAVPVSGREFTQALGSQESRGDNLTLNGAAFERRFGLKCPSITESLESLRELLHSGAQ